MKSQGIIITGSTSVLEVKNIAPVPAKIPVEATVEKITSPFPFVSWGANNQLPAEILKAIGSDEVIFRANEFNKAVHVGQGLTYWREVRTKTGIEKDYSAIPEIDEWLEANDIDRLYASIVEDYESLGNPITSMILSKDRKSVARLIRKQAAWSRYAKQDEKKNVSKMIYNADFSNYKSSDNVVFDVLNTFDPIADLQERKSGFEFILRQRPITAGRYYYDMAAVEVLMNSKNHEMKQLTRDTYRALLKNQMGALWHIELTIQYLEFTMGTRLFTQAKDDPKLMQAELEKIKIKIDEFLSGPDNSGKSILTTKYFDKESKKLESGIIITPLDSKIKQGAWIPSMQQFQAETFYAMGVDPSMIGVANQGDGMNSGSEKKNAFHNNEQTLHLERINTLFPFLFVARYNGWTKKYKGLKFGVQDTPEINHGNSNPSNSK